MNYEEYPRIVAEEVVRLRRRIDASGLPSRKTDSNLVIGTWNIRAFGGLFDSYEENPESPRRNLRAMAYIAEIVSRMDVVAIQEVKNDLTAIRRLLDCLGPTWDVIVSDVTAGDRGNAERLGFVFDRRRVEATGLAGELVLPPMADNQPSRQFARTPYAVSFRAGGEEFVLVTLHVLFGDVPADRDPELRAIAEWLAEWGSDPDRYHDDLIVLGDFNIDRVGDPRFEAFTSTGLITPPALREQRTTIFGTNAKHYDQIAWFMGQLSMEFSGNAGAVDFADAVFQEQTNQQKSFRVSDHLPLWAEFGIDRSTGQLGRTLGIDDVTLSGPDPFASIPD